MITKLKPTLQIPPEAIPQSGEYCAHVTKLPVHLDYLNCVAEKVESEQVVMSIYQNFMVNAANNTSSPLATPRALAPLLQSS